MPVWSVEELQQAVNRFSEELRARVRDAFPLWSPGSLSTLAVLVVLNAQEAVSEDAAVTLDNLVDREPASAILNNNGAKRNVLKQAIGTLVFKVPAEVRKTNKKFYYAGKLLPAPVEDSTLAELEVGMQQQVGEYLSGADVWSAKLTALIQDAQASLSSFPQANMGHLSQILEKAREELETGGLRGRTIALLGDTSQGKSWIANLLVMLSLVDRFTYKNANKGILKNDDLEAMADFIKESSQNPPSEDEEALDPIFELMTLEDLKRIMRSDEQDTRDEYRPIRDLFKTGQLNKDGWKPFVLPSGHEAHRTTTARVQIRYGRRCHVRVEYMSRKAAKDIASMHLEQTDGQLDGGDPELARERFECVCSNDPDAPDITTAELTIRPEVGEVLGKTFIYVGTGNELPADRRWIRDVLTKLMAHGGETEVNARRRAVLKMITVYLPCFFVAGGGVLEDPPGTNDDDLLNQMLLRDALNEADTILAINAKDFGSTKCLNALSDETCNFLKRLMEDDSPSQLILLHNIEKENHRALRDCLGEEQEQLTKLFEELKKGSFKAVRTKFNNFVRNAEDTIEDDGQMDTGEDGTSQERKVDQMLGRTKIITALPSLFASLLLDRHEALAETKAVEESLMGESQDEEGTPSYDAALERAIVLTHGYELLGLLETLGLQDYQRLCQGVMDAVSQAVTALTNAPTVGQATTVMKQLNTHTLVHNNGLTSATTNAEARLRDACEALYDDLRDGSRQTDAQNRLLAARDAIEQQPLLAINPLFRGNAINRSVTGRSGTGASIRQIFLGDSSTRSALETFRQAILATMKLFVDEMAKAACQLLQEQETLAGVMGVDGQRRLEQAKRLLQTAVERFMTHKHRRLGERGWLLKQFDKVANDALVRELNDLHQHLVDECATQPPSKRSKGSRAARSSGKKKFLLGDAGFKGLQELVGPILLQAAENLRDSLLEGLNTSYSSLLANFRGTGNRGVRARVALLSYVMRTLSADIASERGDQKQLHTRLERVEAQLRQLLQEDVGSRALGMAVASNVERVSLLEALYACSSFRGWQDAGRAARVDLNRKVIQRPSKATKAHGATKLRLSPDPNHDHLRQVLASNDLEVVDTLGDGSCLFHSLNLGVYGQTNPTMAYQLRIMLCQQLLYNHRTTEGQSAFLALHGRSVEDYTRHMSQSDSWGDELMIDTFAHSLRRPVFLYQAGREDPLVFGAGMLGEPVVIAHVNAWENGAHNHFVHVRARTHMPLRSEREVSPSLKRRAPAKAISRAPEPEYAPPTEPPEEGEIVDKQLVFVLDTNAVHDIRPAFRFEHLYDRLPEHAVIMVPSGVFEELDRHKDSHQMNLRTTARAFYKLRDTMDGQNRRIFKNQSEIMGSGIDEAIRSRLRLRDQFMRTSQSVDRRIQGAVEHLLDRGDDVILFSADMNLRGGCRAFCGDQPVPGRGRLRVVTGGQFNAIILQLLADGPHVRTVEELLNIFNVQPPGPQP